MRDFGCGAHSSNLSNPCWQPNARIWDFLRTLAANNYIHNPLAIREAEAGRYYFECYPHPAILGLFNLQHILKYKVRHHNLGEWQILLGFLQGLAFAELSIENIGNFVNNDLAQNQENENKIDSIICAYVAAYWWRYGIEHSTMIGNITSGYIVTPHSANTQQALANQFGDQINMPGVACAPPQAQGNAQAVGQPVNHRPAPNANIVADFAVEPPDGWSEPVILCATDNGNLWRTSQGEVINPWMRVDRMVHYHLWICFIEEDGEPAVLFEPFANHGQAQSGMKPARQQLNRESWLFLVAGANGDNPKKFLISYRYSPID